MYAEHGGCAILNVWFSLRNTTYLDFFYSQTWVDRGSAKKLHLQEQAYLRLLWPAVSDLPCFRTDAPTLKDLAKPCFLLLPYCIAAPLSTFFYNCLKDFAPNFQSSTYFFVISGLEIQRCGHLLLSKRVGMLTLCSEDFIPRGNGGELPKPDLTE